MVSCIVGENEVNLLRLTHVITALDQFLCTAGGEHQIQHTIHDISSPVAQLAATQSSLTGKRLKSSMQILDKRL